MTTYEDIRNELKTGDIVLFSGKGFISWVIKKVTKNEYSHVGMIIRIDGFDFVALWESTTLSDVPDIWHKKKKGVQIVQLSKRLENYNGKVSVRLLQDFTIGLEQEAIIANLRHEVNGLPYEKNWWSLAKSALDRTKLGKNKKQDLSSLFCSELVAEAYMRLGLIENNQVSSEYTPADFSEKGRIELKKGHLGPEITILNAKQAKKKRKVRRPRHRR